jgi:hypothetical protein
MVLLSAVSKVVLMAVSMDHLKVVSSVVMMDPMLVGMSVVMSVA